MSDFSPSSAPSSRPENGRPQSSMAYSPPSSTAIWTKERRSFVKARSAVSVPFVLEGAIRVFKTAESGREITLYRVEEGQSCILSSGCGSGIVSFPATAVAERATSAAFVSSETVRRLLAEGAAFRDFVLQQYSQRMAEVMELVQEVAFRRVDERLAQWLVEHSSTAERGSGFRAGARGGDSSGIGRPCRHLARGRQPHPKGLGATKGPADIARVPYAPSRFRSSPNAI